MAWSWGRREGRLRQRLQACESRARLALTALQEAERLVVDMAADGLPMTVERYMTIMAAIARVRLSLQGGEGAS